MDWLPSGLLRARRLNSFHAPYWPFVPNEQLRSDTLHASTIAGTTISLLDELIQTNIERVGLDGEAVDGAEVEVDGHRVELQHIYGHYLLPDRDRMIWMTRLNTYYLRPAAVAFAYAIDSTAEYSDRLVTCGPPQLLRQPVRDAVQRQNGLSLRASVQYDRDRAGYLLSLDMLIGFRPKVSNGQLAT